uniref:Cyp53C10 n=1 Tax=Phaffia rhodozyma TaxID=264483 RepID=A0A221SAF8_PHARH|nr:Cyp53C10 [Phaffia rhodozyma]
MGVFELSFPMLSIGLFILTLILYRLVLWPAESSVATIPGPLLARYSPFWLARSAWNGTRSLQVHEAHRTYGKFVRLAPNHVSIADPAAIPIVLGHGTGFLKSEFYDAFVSIRRGVFNTRDRKEHTRKRKLISNVFSQKNVLDFTSYVHESLYLLITRWNALLDHPSSPSSDLENTETVFDTLPWFNFLAFDIIGALAFGRPFGMLETGKDAAPIPSSTQNQAEGKEVKYVEAIKVLNERGDVSATLGCLTPWMRPYAAYHPWFVQRLKSVKHLAGIATAAVSHRLENPPSSDPRDLLSLLQKGKDGNGNELGREELIAEAMTQLIAGSDTTSNSSCAIFYYLATNPSTLEKLQQELDEALFNLDPSSPSVPTYDDVKSLPYLEAVINEALRIHCTSGIGLPRVVPEGGAIVSGTFFKQGTVLSVPTYTVHRDPDIWGDDIEAFRPERWYELDKATMHSAFMPFSTGPRGCVGKNLAATELLLIVSSLAWRYNFQPSIKNQTLPVREGFLRKPTECFLKISRRQHTNTADDP